MKNPGIGIDLVCFDAEDSGLPQWAENGMDSEHTWCLGSQHWAQNPHIPRYRARYGILLDMVGGNNTWFRKEGFSMYYAPSVVDKVWSAAQRLGYSNYFVNDEGGYITDDHLPLNRAAIPCINIIGSDVQDGGFCSTWHTVNDNIGNINKQTLKAVGQTVLEVIYNEK
jgi:Zn-dependent M28 family amino/carboxypeptidase